jgi:SET domain-containing protein
MKLPNLKHFFNPYIKVRKSKIHGSGVYAKKNIKKGTKIIDYLGLKITHKESEKLYEEMLAKHKKNPKKNASVYTFTLDDNFDLNGDVWWNLAKYFNHSCNGNCESCSEEDGTITIYSLTNIKKGEELTYNYGYGVDNYKDHPCKCGSYNCVGYIVSQDEWKKLEKLKKTKSKTI